MSPTPESVFALVHDRPGAAWLDNGEGGQGWSILTWEPSEIISNGHDWPQMGRSLLRPTASVDQVPFAGGCLGYLGYGAGHYVEAVPPQAPSPEPEIWLGRYEGALCYRHRDRSWHPAGCASFRAEAEWLLEAATPLEGPVPPPEKTGFQSVHRSHFEADVRRILDWIRAGDCYQVNLTRPVLIEAGGSPWPAYRRLRRHCAAQYGAYLNVGSNTQILSNSPELFLEVRDRNVRSEPIKGTSPRHPDPKQDRNLAIDLMQCEKNKAELTMIVDLVRNDLGRVAIPGSVKTGPRTLRSLSHVHHTHQSVTARLTDEADAWSALGAAFPPGSVTGAPKVRACQRIAELESTPRGVYCGAIGFVADGGRSCWSVAIRTAIYHAGLLRYHVGGGIVAESEPDLEWWETVHKGAALALALTGQTLPEARQTQRAERSLQLPS